MQVRGWSQEVLSWLQEVQPDQLADANGRGQCCRLACFAAWVRVGALFEVEAAYVNNFIELAFQLCTSPSEGTLAVQSHLELVPELLCSCAAVI